jgi:hypothetical protein
MRTKGQTWVVVGFLMLGTGCMNVSSTDAGIAADDAGLIEIDGQKCMMTCVDKALVAFGVAFDMKTSPALITDILKNDMLLADLPSAKTLLNTALTKPVDLKPMLLAIRKAILEKQPAVNEFLCAAVDAKLIPRVTDSATKAIINRVIHHTYILNELTVKMAASYPFQIEVMNHVMAKRAGFGIRTDLVGALEDLKKIYGGQMFGPTKIVSMDLANQLFAKVRAYGVISPTEEATLKGALKLNILEAAVTENLAGYNDNGMAGAVLAAIAPKTITLAADTRNLQWDLSQNWDSLYETWNLAFITGNATYLQVYFPKLLIPSVIAADRLSYISNRAMSLWVSLNFRLFAALTGKPDMQVPNKEALTELWGAVNLKYAEALATAETGYPIAAFAPMLNTTLAQIMEYMKQSFSAVPLTAEEKARLDALYATP